MVNKKYLEKAHFYFEKGFSEGYYIGVVVGAVVASIIWWFL
jgi:hypothetical protein